MTRDTDVFVTLSQRPKIANKAKANMFISIHANAAVSSKMNGVEVFYFSKKSSPYAERIASVSYTHLQKEKKKKLKN